MYTQYKPREKGDDTEVNGVGRLIKTKGMGTVVLYLEDDTVKIQNLIFKHVYYFPGAPKLLIRPPK